MHINITVSSSILETLQPADYRIRFHGQMQMVLAQGPSLPS